MVILYFRAECHSFLKVYQSKYKEYLQGAEDENILTYGEESEGVVLDICSRLFKMRTDVIEVRKKEVKKYEYCKEEKKEVQLLFYENHYDIIEHNSTSQIRAEKSEIKRTLKR